MSKFEQRMEKIFDIVPETENTKSTQLYNENLSRNINNITTIETLDDDLVTDYNTIRNNFHELIETGKSALEEIVEIAKDTSKSRDFEVAAGILKNVVEANEKMLDMHKKIREITNYKQQTSEKTTINNALFVGSTAELSKLVKDLNEKNIN